MIFNRLKSCFFDEKKEEKAMKGQITSPLVSPLKGATFFDRVEEEEKLKNLLAIEPRLSLLVGPPSCGKTSMILHLLEKLSHTRPIIHINLRGMSFSNADELYFALDRKFSPFLFKAKDYIPQKMKFMQLFEAEKGPKTGDREIPAIEKFNNFFEKITEVFSQHKKEKKSLAPILLIDEAHALFSLAKTKDGNEVLYNLFQWFAFVLKRNYFFMCF